MSLPEQEARALESAKEFLYALGNGQYKITTITALRADARSFMKHFPLVVGPRWMEAHGETFTEREDIAREGEA